MKEIRMEIIRERYLSQIRPYYDLDLIKVITGVRRAGKSVLLNSIQKELAAKGVDSAHLIYINHEDLDYEYIVTASDLHKEIKKRITDDQKYYIFLDEIQHVKDFEKALASFRATWNVSLFVTGSNSTLLSGELATLLTGRTVEFEILPFSFSEMKEYCEVNHIPFDENSIFDYIKWGGFPLRLNLTEEEEIRRYLMNLYESIINRDIIKKSGSFDKKSFMDISLYLMANAGKELSVDNVVKIYKENNKTISRRTVYSYIEKMKKAYLVHGVSRYNITGKTSLKNKEKLYAVDTGFRTINTNTISYEDTFFLENIIYNELVSRGYHVFTGKTYKGEVDFVAVKNGKKCFIQVTYYMVQKATIDREFGAFSPITDASPKYVMSLDRLDLSREGIAHINIVDFLLGKVDLSLT